MVAIVDPVARGYRFIVPASARNALSRFGLNLAYPKHLVNSLFQGPMGILRLEGHDHLAPEIHSFIHFLYQGTVDERVRALPQTVMSPLLRAEARGHSHHSCDPEGVGETTGCNEPRPGTLPL